MIDTSADYRSQIYANERTVKSRATITIQGNTTVYDDTTVIRMNVLEESDVLNAELPSNELSLTMDNSTGVFDYLTMANMEQIIASKPTISAELGAVIIRGTGETFTTDFNGKISGSVVENQHKAYRVGVTALQSPSALTTELSQGAYNLIAILDGSTTGGNVTLNGYKMQANFHFNVLWALEQKYGLKIWEGATLTADKITKAKSLITSVMGEVVGYGNAVGDNTTRYAIWNVTSSTWENTDSTFLQSNVSLTATKTDLTNYLDANGYIYFSFYTNGTSNGTTPANLYLDYADLFITTKPFEIAEFVSVGKYIVTEFTNDVTSRIVTLIGRDILTVMGDTLYTPTRTGATTLMDLIQELINKTTFSLTDFALDGSVLGNTACNPFPPNEQIDCRTALQMIGIAGQCTIWQDRYGKLQIKQIAKLDAKINFANYASTQSGLYHYAGGTTYALETTSSGMRYIDYDQMYEPPKVSLEKSIYQINVKTYPTVGAEGIDNVYTNTSLGGTSGQSFTIDNVLVKDTTLAQKIVDWYMAEMKYNAIYEIHWRQNMMLEALDIILAEDSFDALKRSRITRQEFIYEGYLEGNTTSRGGL